MTILGVLLAFIAEPWVRGDGKAQGSIAAQASSGVAAMKQGIGGKVARTRARQGQGVDVLQQKASEALKSLNAGDAF